MDYSAIISLLGIIVPLAVGSGWFIRRSIINKEKAQAKLAEAQTVKTGLETQTLLKKLKEPDVLRLMASYETLLASHLKLMKPMEQRIKTLEAEVEKLWKGNKELIKINGRLKKAIAKLSQENKKLREKNIQLGKMIRENGNN